MKRFFTHSVLFIFLSIAFSSFTACTNPAVNQQTAVNGDPQPASGSKEAKNNDYPPAPSMIMQTEIRDLDGNKFKIEDKKGKVVLVNLWAIWCGPCVAEMPAFAKMQEQYKDKGFEVIGLNTGDDEGHEEPIENIRKFIEQKKINYQIAYGDDQIYEEFNKKTRSNGIPQSMVINREGQMIFVVGGGGPRVVNQIQEVVDKAVNE